MPIIFKPKRSFVAGNTPANLASGEMACNIPDRKIWIADNSNVPRLIVGGPVALADLTDVSITSPSTSETLTYLSGKWTNVNVSFIDGGNF